MEGFFLFLGVMAIIIVSKVRASVRRQSRTAFRPNTSREVLRPSHRSVSNRAQPTYPTPSHSSRLRGTAWVIDGDTIVIDSVNIRLAGIDAPELDHPYGRNAKYALIQLCKGQTVLAEMDGSSSYDRPVATCYLADGRDLSAEMVKLGLALDWRAFSGGKYRHLEADDARRRLWRCDARQKGLMPPRLLD